MPAGPAHPHGPAGARDRTRYGAIVRNMRLSFQPIRDGRDRERVPALRERAAGPEVGLIASSTARSPGRAGHHEPAELGERFADALSYASRVHRGQTRRGQPYVAHLLRVTLLVLEEGGSEDEAIAALLHDAAEDQGGHGRLHDIRSRFGDDVADIVDSCTDSYELPPPPWRVRKEHYLEHLPASSPSALRVSLADKVDNVRAILRDPATAGSPDVDDADARWYYTRLARLFERLWPGAQADELTRLAAQLQGTPQES